MPSRRGVLRAVGIGVAGGLAGCSESGERTTTTRATGGAAVDVGALSGERLLPADGDAGDNFGAAVALTPDGSTALVGAPRDEDPNGAKAGAAYVFEQTGGGWAQRAKLAPEDGTPDDQFGSGVALAPGGTTAVVGARFDEDPNGPRGGSAHVFERSGGEWSRRAKLAPEEGNARAFFGASLTLARGGSTAFVTALGERDPNGRQGGAVYVYRRSNGTWTRDGKLAAADGDEDDLFGFGFDVSDDGRTAVVGAMGDEDPNGTTGDLFGGAGSAYVFERSGGEWHQRAKLAPEDGDAGDQFGAATALSPDEQTAFVGAFTDDDPNGGGAGSVYVFERTGDGWTRQAKLAPDDGDGGDGFGRALATMGGGDVLLVGAEGDDDPNGEGAGSVYAFERGADGWRQRAKVAPDSVAAGAGFGRSLTAASESATAIAGALRDTTDLGTESGAAYVLEG